MWYFFSLCLCFQIFYNTHQRFVIFYRFQATVSNLHIGWIDLNASTASAKLFRGNSGSSRANKRIEYCITGLREKLDEPCWQINRKGGAMSAIVAFGGKVENIIRVS